MNETRVNTYLEDMLTHEAKCEAAHTFNPCSIAVTHRFLAPCEHIAKMICANVASGIRYQCTLPGICIGCHAPIAECWTVTPA